MLNQRLAPVFHQALILILHSATLTAGQYQGTNRFSACVHMSDGTQYYEVGTFYHKLMG